MFWKRKGHKFRTLNNDTIASNPSQIRLNPLIWFPHDFLKIMFHLSLFVISIVATFASSYYYLIFVFLTMRLIFLYWIEIEEKFQANSIGGQVISLSPPLVAVCSDLSRSNYFFPAIKIIPFKVKRKIHLGEKVVTVAAYRQGANEEIPYWEDFFPIPAEYATDDKDELSDALESYDEHDWNELAEGLKLVPQPYKPGLYRVHIEDHDWNLTD